MPGEVYEDFIIDNDKNQLCMITKNNQKSFITPQLISLPFEISQIACGDGHTLFLTSNFSLYIALGIVFGVGNNENGKLGFAKEVKNLNTPEIVVFPRQVIITKISCGWSHSLALDSTGTAFSWGFGKMGALGTGEFSNVYRPQEIKLSKVSSVICGSQHSGFITSTGKLFTCGYNCSGQLGLGSDRKSVV